MDDQTLLQRIEALVAEEHSLQGRERDDAAHGREPEDERQRLQTVSVELDRCWDLLRQRRALRESGRNPDDAAVRDASTVEHYQQ
jgi:hypothetical protein